MEVRFTLLAELPWSLAKESMLNSLLAITLRGFPSLQHSNLDVLLKSEECDDRLSTSSSSSFKAWVSRYG